MEGKQAKVIENAEGSRTTPSVVAFSKGLCFYLRYLINLTLHIDVCRYKIIRINSEEVKFV
jgi:hypothetical protein